MRFDLKNKCVYFAGHHGRVSSACWLARPFDSTRFYGMSQKLFDVAKLKAPGRSATTPLREGVAVAYAVFLATGGRMAA